MQVSYHDQKSGKEKKELIHPHEFQERVKQEQASSSKSDTQLLPFQFGQIIQLKVEDKHLNERIYVPATVATVNLSDGSIWVKYKLSNQEWSETIYKFQFDSRIKTDKVGNEAQPEFKESKNATGTHTQETQDVKHDDNKTEKDESISNIKKMGLKVGDAVQVLTDDNEWVDGLIMNVLAALVKIQTAKDKIQIFISEQEVMDRVKQPVLLNYSEKSISDWSNNDVEHWVESTPAFKKYAKKFGKTMDGKELLDTTSDDLQLIIPSQFHRKKFMEKLRAEKEKNKVSENDNKLTKSNPDVNGLVCLNNMGNTCYLNTSIQLLSHTPYLTRYLKKRAKSHDFITANNSGKWKTFKKCVSNRSLESYNKQNEINGRNMLNSWTNLCDIIYNKPKQYSKYIHKPSGIRSALHDIDSDFGSGRQDDSVRSLTIMLQALDSEIEEEINQNKASVAGKYMDKYQLKHGNVLSKSDENKVIATLLSKHNPNSSIVRKTFDGVERLIYECLHCNKILQQYVMFRDLDLPVISHDVTFSNIYIIFNDECLTLPTCILLDYCSIDVLKYKVIRHMHLDEQKEDKIDIREIDIVTLSNCGELKYFNRDNKVSELQQSKDNIFVLVNNSYSKHKHQSQSKLLQFKIFIDKKGEPSISQYPQYKYIKCNQNDVCTITNDEIAQTTKTYNHIVYYNGNILSPKQGLMKNDFKGIHNEQSCINVLFLLCVDLKNDDFDLNINNIDGIVIDVATDKYPNYHDQPLTAVKKYKQWKQSKGKYDSNLNSFGIPQLKHKSQNNQRIDNTVNELNKCKYIHTFIENWMKSNFKLKVSNTKPLTDINECLQEYQKTTIVDNTVFEYQCIHCNKQCRWTKISKLIVSTPPVLILHLDRFGKNTYKKSNKNKHYYYSSFESNKFDHEIQYKYKFTWKGCDNEQYSLFGVSNHSGTTQGGHYTATIKCLTDAKWYSISDSHCSSTRDALQNQKSATILMYSLSQK